tara:strand:- start:860 stop:1150 length:291 start_codon:yes stop_codon:yes gene_type:complete
MKYIIKDADDNVTNYITADAEFVEANFEHYELWVEPTPVEPTAEEEARQWRDMELSLTDWIVPLSDHPQREAYITYRESLRQWPSTESFPETKPEL